MAVTSEWTCDVCGTRLSSQSEDRPDGWQRLALLCSVKNTTKPYVVCDIDYANFVNGVLKVVRS